MPNNKSPHILSTAANLLGFCLIVLTSVTISKYNQSTIIDEFTGVASMFLITSALLSFLSIRSSNYKKSNFYEQIADIAFLIALFIIFTVIFFVSFIIVF